MNLYRTFRLTLPVVLIALSLGCSNAIRIPLNGEPLSNNLSTIIVWMDQKPMLINKDVPIYIDGIVVGIVSAKKPLKATVEPGNHRMWGSLANVIDRAIDINLEPGHVHYYRVFLKCGMWVCSIYTSPTAASPYYESVIHKLHDKPDDSSL